MQKPTIYYNNVLRDALSGTDGTVYGTITQSLRVPSDPFKMMTTSSLISDLSADYTKIVGKSLIFDTTGNKYRIVGQGTNTGLPAARKWLSICYGNGVFIAFAGPDTTDKYATSPDGIVWTERAMPASRQWYRACWSGTQFCVVAYNSDKCATSTDGVNWTEHDLPATRNWNRVIFGGNTFVAIAGGATAGAYSTDGASWTESTLGFTSGSSNVLGWNGSAFFIGSDGSTQSGTSADGITWTGHTIDNNQKSDVAWNGSTFCQIGVGVRTTWTSTDGITWTAHTNALSTASDWRAIAWNGQTFIAVCSDDGKVATSDDGVTWTDHSLPDSSKYCAIAWGPDVWCTVAGLDATSQAVAVSADASYWPTGYIQTLERIQDEDAGGTAKVYFSLAGSGEDPARTMLNACDNALSPAATGQTNTALYLRSYAPNFVTDGGFESGGLTHWTAGANWAINTANKLEGAYSAAFDFGATNHLQQTCTGRLIKGKTYRVLFKAKSVTANPTSGALTVQVLQTGTNTTLYSAISGNVPAVTTTAAWFSVDIVADFSTDNWYLKFTTDHTKANSATKLLIDEVYFYEKRTISALIIDRHNLVGKSGIVVKGWKVSPLRSTASSDANNYGTLATIAPDTADVISSTLTTNYDPIVELYIPASSGWAAEMGDVYIGDSWSLPRYPQSCDPYMTNGERLREFNMNFTQLSAAYRKAQIEQLFEQLRTGNAIYTQWDTDAPVLMISKGQAMQSAYDPYRVSMNLSLVEVP